MYADMVSNRTLLLLVTLCVRVLHTNAYSDIQANIGTGHKSLQASINAADTHSNNSSLLDIHVRIYNDLLVKQALLSTATEDTPLRKSNLVQEFVNILWNTENLTEWQQMLQTFTTFATNTPNLSSKYVTYEALWRKLQTVNLRYDPINVLMLFEYMQQTIRSINSTAKAIVPIEFTDLQTNISTHAIQRCAQLLEAPLHIQQDYQTSYTTDAKNCTQFPIVERILDEMQRLPEYIFNQTLNTLFDAVQQLESAENIALALRCFGGSVQQRLYANIKYQQRLHSHVVASTNVISMLQRNIEELVRNADLGQLPVSLLVQIDTYLPHSLRTLRESSAICIRNATDVNSYLYECGQTFLMCTHEDGNQYRAVFSVQRLLGHKFIFRSSYWSARYIKLESAHSVIGATNNTLPTAIKNVYSDLKSSVWQAVFVGDLVAFLDVDMRYYLCGGNPTMWSGSEHHAYTRRAQDFQLHREECLWLVEDCSSSV